jgi:4-amino-4-deoxy-L-arabinose transferase-like glycosyltransferase
VAIYSLAKEMSSADGAIFATAFYLFIPYGILASRSFQPDPLMVSVMLWAVRSIYLWSSRPSLGNALLTGVLCGFAILVKPIAILPLIGVGLCVALISFQIRDIVGNKQIWLICLASVLPAGIYYLVLSKNEASNLIGSFVFSFRELLIQPSFYIRWAEKLNSMIGIGTFVACLLGAILFERRKDKALAFGLLIGYLSCGIVFPYHFQTHDYYHLMIIPIVAICISSFVSIILQEIAKQPSFWRFMALMVLLFVAGFQLWNARVELARKDFRAEIDGWKRLVRELPTDGEILAITQSYGFRLQYFGWQSVHMWPSLADISRMELEADYSFDYQKEFSERSKDMDYFLITNFSELENQPELKSILYENYPDPVRGYAHLIFNLRGESSP